MRSSGHKAPSPSNNSISGPSLPPPRFPTLAVIRLSTRENFRTRCTLLTINWHFMFGAPFSVKHSFEVIYFFKNITKKFIFFREEAKIKI